MFEQLTKAKNEASIYKAEGELNYYFYSLLLLPFFLYSIYLNITLYIYCIACAYHFHSTHPYAFHLYFPSLQVEERNKM